MKQFNFYIMFKKFIINSDPVKKNVFIQLKSLYLIHGPKTRPIYKKKCDNQGATYNIIKARFNKTVAGEIIKKTRNAQSDE